MRPVVLTSASVLLALLLFASFSRIEVVSGVVRDSTGATLGGAVVRVKATLTVVVTPASTTKLVSFQLPQSPTLPAGSLSRAFLRPGASG